MTVRDEGSDSVCCHAALQILSRRVNQGGGLNGDSNLAEHLNNGSLIQEVQNLKTFYCKKNRQQELRKKRTVNPGGYSNLFSVQTGGSTSIICCLLLIS